MSGHYQPDEKKDITAEGTSQKREGKYTIKQKQGHYVGLFGGEIENGQYTEGLIIDALDEQILKLIAGNARIPFLEVARACNVSGAAIHQRIQKLTNLGILKGSEYVIDPEKIGYETCAYIGIYLKDPESFDSVTKALEAIPEVVECHFTTGKYDMFIKIYAKNNHHLLSIIHDKLQPLGLARTETLISFHEAIKRQMPIMVDIEDED